MNTLLVAINAKYIQALNAATIPLGALSLMANNTMIVSPRHM